MSGHIAILGRAITKRCNNLPDKKLNPNSCREKCACAKALLGKEILTARDIFDELGNYNYCSAILGRVVHQNKLSRTRTQIIAKIAAIMPGFRYATARTILRHKIENYICGMLPGESSEKCVKAVLKEFGKDNRLIKLRLTERKKHSRENEKCSIIPYDECKTPFHLFNPIDMSGRYYRLHEVIEADDETQDDSSETFSDESSETEEVPSVPAPDPPSEFFDSFTATVNLKFWDRDVPYEMTMENVSIDVEKCECTISFSQEDYEHFIAKRQRRN